MPNPHLVHIPSPGRDKPPLSRAQLAFNRLTNEIGELEQRIRHFRTVATTLQQRIYTEYEPLLREYNQLRVNLVRLFDRAYEQPDTSRPEKRKLAELIVNLASELVDDYGLDELTPILHKYAADAPSTTGQEQLISYQEPPAEERVQPKTDEGTPDAEEPQKAKSAKQQKREARKQIEERNITKAVRTLYMDLVKAFHPDREPDEAEKIRKTGIMQRVTEAYQKSDLLALLRLQLEFNRIDQQHLEKLADEQLKYYNKILQQQADELTTEFTALQHQLALSLGKPVTTASLSGLEFGLNSDVRQLKKRVKELKKEVRALMNPDVLKAWLKGYSV
ncbi:hypothetical protein [Spirosoma taeanense]|nr:hypothetical protein [Spirosoma taeanense]